MSTTTTTSSTAPAVTSTQPEPTSTTTSTTTVPTPSEQEVKLPTASQELDIAFCCDCTGSMGSYIKSAQENIRQISSSIHAKTEGKANLRFSLVKFRDHPPQDHTFITESFPFTSNLELMKRHVDTMAAAGGGDGPEAVAAALHEVNILEWRPNATKIVVLIADAPPHGLGESGDGFPEGCPLGHDPIKICKEMAAKGIVVYAVGVEPILSTSYKFARDFMMMVADITDGKFLPLGKASVLTDVVVNGAIEGSSMKQLWADLEAETAKEAQDKGLKLTKEQLILQTEERLASKKDQVVMHQIDVSNPYMDSRYNMSNCVNMRGATSLAEARKGMDSNLNKHVAQESAGYNWTAQSASSAPMPMQQQQQQRMQQQAYKQNDMFHY